MASVLSLAELRHIRLRNQRLTNAAPDSSCGQIVHDLFGVQSQEWKSAQLAFHARSTGITQAEVKHGREVERRFVLTWALRGTLHLVTADDLHWLLKLCGPPAIRATNSRYQQHGLTEGAREQGLEAIEDILGRDGPLNRAQLAEALAARGVPVAGQAIHHLVRFAALRGLVCLGAEHEGELTVVLLDTWLNIDSTRSELEDPAAEMAKRYLSAYGPATLADFARWSGLSRAQVKAAWEATAAECAQVETHDGEMMLIPREQHDQLASESVESSLRLLPRYDNYLLGYASRGFMVAEPFAKRVHPGGGLIRACLLIDGEAKGNWKLEKRRKGIRIVVSPFERLHSSILPQLEAESQSLGRFLNTDAELRVEGS